MLGTRQHRPSAGPASAFFIPTEPRGSQPDIWTEAGRAIESAYRQPAPVGQAEAVRGTVAVALAIAIALVFLAKHH
jgi:hypothetical protein